ncbi:hypothetical protein H0A36_22715 [Endozoicomonas sp. SM1973]|uniref:DUF4139 domain-containing protein n=1 Tax=Spartinivicinus marinus TaxID=2994442 RepID=A0A853IIA6_9GAMM|nr:hypothetical protein [Spartinivicinus marinus]MCX4025895.1 hypothetical protein [Spartinivicinus marinus]NYZ68835.1 hypothetical protein [Spartinivicinus marinus]
MLPITRVVLFKHGVAYYQHDGQVTDNEIIQLSFKQEQMNDVLKSLTTLDFNDGTFGALSYDSEEPIDKRLAEFNIKIPKKGAITSLLDQLKGVKVKLNHDNQAITGSIIGIEELPIANDNNLSAPYLAIYTLAKGIVHYRLSALSEITIEDHSVQEELNSLLDIFAASLNKGQKRLSIYTVGKGKRKISIAYVVAAPVWKTSYRLVLPDSQSNTANANNSEKQLAILQGWALIDNTTDEDWRNIKLSLVAGLPISFIHDLYTPRFRQRPEIAVEQAPVTAPPIVERGYQTILDEPEAMLDLAESDTEVFAAAAAEPITVGAAPTPLSRAKAFEQSINIQTQHQEMGDLFSYDITQPVDVERGRSALVPILQTNMAVNKILFFNADIRDINPMSSVFLQNRSELTLEGGPITVFEGDNYVGEAMLGTMKTDSEQVIPYSVELGVTIRKKITTSERFYTQATNKQQLIIRHYREEYMTEYTVASTLNEAATLYLDHPFSYELNEDTDDLIETTDNYWRFHIPLPAKQQINYQVVEVKRSYDAIQIPNIAYQEIQAMNQLKLISSEIKQQLEVIANLSAEKTSLVQQHKQQLNQLKKIEKGQDRIRKNIEALGSTPEESQLRQRYVKTLSNEEDQLEKLSQEMNKLDKAVNNKSTEIEQAIEELRFG